MLVEFLFHCHIMIMSTFYSYRIVLQFNKQSSEKNKNRMVVLKSKKVFFTDDNSRYAKHTKVKKGIAFEVQSLKTV